MTVLMLYFSRIRQSASVKLTNLCTTKCMFLGKSYMITCDPGRTDPSREYRFFAAVFAIILFSSKVDDQHSQRGDPT